MLAVILAAGKGKRLAEITKDTPKCLIEIGSKTIIERQIKILEKNRVSKIYVVVGYKAETIMERVKNRKIVFIINEDYENTDNIYSLYLTKNYVAGKEFILLNGDAVFDEEIISKMIDDGNIIAIDSKYYDREELKIKGKEFAVEILPKNAEKEESDGSTIGIFKFSSKGSKLLFEEIEKLIGMGEKKRWFEYAINNILSKEKFYLLDVNGLKWMEIDTPEDLERARKIWKE